MSVKRRGGEVDGNWFYRFSYKGTDFCEGGFPNKQQATEAERLKRNAVIAQGLHPEDFAGEMTFRQAGEWWLKEYAPQKRSKRNDFSRITLMMDFFDNKLLRDIQPADVDRFLSKLSDLRGEKISDHTRNHYLAMIRALYERLKHKRMYKGENPASFVDKIQVPVARVRFIRPAEEKILTPAVATEPDVFVYYRLGLETGMRMGEMRAIRVKDVDMTLRHIFVPTPKNNRSRYVPFEGPLEGFLANLIANKEPEDYLLPHWGHAFILAHFKAICERVGIKNLKPHDWRHTFAYNCLSQGEPLYKVSKLMGHSSSAVTEKHYGHLAAKDLRDTMERVKPFLSCNRIATADQIYKQREDTIYPKSR